MMAAAGLRALIPILLLPPGALVAPPRAVVGLALRAGEEVVVAAAAAGLAALLRDPARAQARAARALVERRYGWEDSAAGVGAAWRAAMEVASRRTDERAETGERRR